MYGTNSKAALEKGAYERTREFYVARKSSQLSKVEDAKVMHMETVCKQGLCMSATRTRGYQFSQVTRSNPQHLSVLLPRFFNFFSQLHFTQKAPQGKVENQLIFKFQNCRSLGEERKNMATEIDRNAALTPVAPLAPVTREHRVRTDLETSIPKPCKLSLSISTPKTIFGAKVA